jgi:SNF2 family DNA or RNA helicase
MIKELIECLEYQDYINYSDEKLLQEEIYSYLVAFEVDREVQLEKGLGIIDFIVTFPEGTRVGIELKTKPKGSELFRQLHKYARSEKIDLLILVTTKEVDVVEKINEKEVYYINISHNALLSTKKNEFKQLSKDKMVYGNIHFDPNHNEWIIEDILPDARMILRRIFSGLQKTRNKGFRFKNTPHVLEDLHWFMGRYPMNSSEKDSVLLNTKILDIKKRKAANFKIIHEDKDVLHNLNVKYNPYKFQNQFVEFFQTNSKMVLADQMGLGKTEQAYLGILKKEAFPSIIVCETGLWKQWKSRGEKFTHLDIETLESGKKTLRKGADVYIVTYSMLKNREKFLLDLDAKMIVFDEVQNLRTGDKSTKYQVAENITSRIENILGLSGTPIYNYGNEIFNIFNIVYPDFLGTSQEFNREWTKYGEYEVKDPVALGMFLINNNVMLRRTKQDIKLNLPKVHKLVSKIKCDQDKLDEIKEKSKYLAELLLFGERLEKGRATRELTVMIRRATGIAKAPYIVEYCKMLLKTKKKIILAGWHLTVYDILKEGLKEFNPSIFRETHSKKQKALDEFMKDDDCRILIIPVRAGAGIDGLQHACNTLVIGELDWTNAAHDQLIERIDRVGQKHEVDIHFLVSDSADSSDQEVIDRLAIKKVQSDGIVNPTGKQTENILANSNIIKNIAKNILKK